MNKKEILELNDEAFLLWCQSVCDIPLDYKLIPHLRNSVKQYYKETKIGIILHWGLYSVYAFDDIKSLRRRKMKNGSEWYMKRLITKETDFRPISGYKETQKYHEKNFPNSEYFDVIPLFNKLTEKWNPDIWFEYFKNIGINYVILTSKHHDGFCLFDTKTTKNKSERDLLKLFIDSGRKYKIKVGIYYSLMEFNKRVTIDFLNDIVIPQINELRKYKPDIWWFDGNWEFTTQYAKQVMKDISDKLKKDNSDVLINDRIIGGNYKNYSDRYIPSEINPPILSEQDKFWESIQTIGNSWGYCKVQEKEDYKSGKDLKEIYDKIKEFNGKFLLNLGPKPDGSFDGNEIKSLNEFIKIK